VVFLNAAVGATSKLDALYMSHTRIGGAQHQFGRPQDGSTHIKRDTYGKENTFRQPVFGHAIDDLISIVGAPFPNHIKIDVDGNEVDIVEGARKTLANSELKSILIEIRPDNREAQIRKMLADAGLHLVSSHGLNHIFARHSAKSA
jgi:FkbM family methyltransferase